jgi:hypothetical protein
VAARTPTVFCLTTNRLIDVVRKGEEATTALERLAHFGPDLTILPLAEAQERYEAQFKTEPVEIAEQAWHQALCILPPEDWRSDPNGDSFKSPERTAGTITAIYVRVNDRHFTFNDDATTPHADCLRRVATSRAWQEAQEGPAR